MATDRVGVLVICAVCGKQKKPMGRSGPLGVDYCERYPLDDRCEGYDQEPLVGSLWPGEKASEFGYPCGTDGTREVGEDRDEQ